MFEHQWIETYRFEDIPLDRDIYLMEERWLPAPFKTIPAPFSDGSF